MTENRPHDAAEMFPHDARCGEGGEADVLSEGRSPERHRPHDAAEMQTQDAQCGGTTPRAKAKPKRVTRPNEERAGSPKGTAGMDARRSEEAASMDARAATSRGRRRRTDAPHSRAGRRAPASGKRPRSAGAARSEATAEPSGAGPAEPASGAAATASRRHAEARCRRRRLQAKGVARSVDFVGGKADHLSEGLKPGALPLYGCDMTEVGNKIDIHARIENKSEARRARKRRTALVRRGCVDSR